MSFLAILISIAIELGIKSLEGWRRFDWFDQWTDRVMQQMHKSALREGPVGLLAIVAPLLLAIWIVFVLLNNAWFLLGFVFSIFVLSMSLGPVDPMRQAQDYIDAMQADNLPEANRHATALLGRAADDNPVLTAEQVKEVILIRICENILGVFLWFILLGPVGAVLFRASCLLKHRYEGMQGGLAGSIRDLYRILMWIPARLSVLAFAIVGNFVETLQSLQHYSDLWRRDSEELLLEAGMGAIPTSQHDDERPDIAGVVEVLSLAKRSVVAWIVVLSVLVIVGWLV